MPDTITDRKITQDEIRQLMAPMELDLIAAFKVIQEDIITGMEGYQGTPEEYINEVLKNLQGEELGTAVLKSIIKEQEKLLKGKSLPPGTRRQRKDGIYVKQPDGTWIKETEKKVSYENYIQNEEKELNNAITQIKGNKQLTETIINFTSATAAKNAILRGELSEKDFTKEGYQKQIESIKEMDSIYDKLPVLKNDIEVFRGMPLTQEQINTFKNVGNIITEKGYSSTSTDANVAETFSKEGIKENQKAVILKIKIKAGNKALPVGMIDEVLKQEKEMLLNRNQRFKINAFEENDKVNIELETIEVEEGMSKSLQKACKPRDGESPNEFISKGKPLPPGTRRQRSDGVYIKQPDGTWLKETEEKEKKVEISDEDKEKIEEYKKQPIHRLKQQLSGIEFQLKPFENKDISKLDRFQRMAYDTYKNQQKLLQIAIKEKEKKKESKKTEQQLKEQKENIIQNLDKKHFVDSADINNIVSYVKEKYPEAKGVRFIESHFKEYDYNKGDELPESKKWIDGKPTDETLGGTSTIRTDDYFTPQKEGGYGAKKIFIVGGSDISGGEDPNEGVVNDAYIIDIIEIPEKKGNKNMKVNKVCKPRGGESQNEFISRCIKEQMGKGKSQEKAQGMCYGIWRNAKKADFRKTIKSLISVIEKIMKKS